MVFNETGNGFLNVTMNTWNETQSPLALDGVAYLSQFLTPLAVIIGIVVLVYYFLKHFRIEHYISL